MDLPSHVEDVVPSKYEFKALNKKIHIPSLMNLYKLMILKGCILHKESPRDESFESKKISVQFHYLIWLKCIDREHLLVVTYQRMIACRTTIMILQKKGVPEDE